jgi:hypothetical protein
MFTSLVKPLQRSAAYLSMLILAGACGAVQAQSPLVVSSTAVAVPHNETYANPWQNTVSNRGDFVLLDFKTTGLYQYPAGNGAEITLGAPGAIAGKSSDSGVAIDPRKNNLYIDNNYNGGLIEYPYDAKTGTWDLPSVQVAQALAGNVGGSTSCGMTYFQSVGLSINDNGVMAVATENGCGVEIFTVPIDLQGNFGAASPVVSNLKARAKTVAIDDAGNISWNEDAGGVAGALYLPAGTTGLNTEATATRIDPGLSNVMGVSTDQAGNIYVADGTAGVYLVPMVKGVPNTAGAQLLTLAPASSNASLDQQHGILFVPTSGFGTFKDLVKIYLNRAELGTAAAGSMAAAPATITYTFSGSVTPSSFVIDEAGSAGDFAVATGGTCTAGTAYAAGSSCTLSVNLTPHTVGDVSATLLMLDAKMNILASTNLHGIGQAASVVGFAGTESALGSGLKTPSQIAVDASQNVYVADSGLGKVLEFVKGAAAGTAPVSIGTGLTAPTGVAVDGAGDVYIADSGRVIEVPSSVTGLNAAGQITLESGFGNLVQLAADGIGNVFVADPTNNRVADLRALTTGISEQNFTGFTQLSAIATDGIGDLFLANGQNLVEISALGVQSTLLTTLSNTTGLAVDASGAVYVTSTTQTLRIPNEGGTLNPAHQIVLAASVTDPTSVAVDAAGDAYVVNGTALNIDSINANGFINLGTLNSTTGTATGSVTLVNNGNLPLTVTGFSSTPDYMVTANTCVGSAIAVGLTCNATVTFNPGAGDQGTLTAQLLVQGNQANAPIGINVTGVGAPLAASKTALTVANASVTNTTVTVTVASASGTGAAPTGSVTLTATATGGQPVVLTQALTGGTVTFTETMLPAGKLTFTANYLGDRVYGTSSATTTATISAGAVTLVQPASVPTYVLAAGTGAEEPYDGSQLPYYYNYPVVVKTANGAPLLGVPIINAAGIQTGVNYGTVSYVTPAGAPICSGTAAVINVNADGTAPFPTSCFSINTSNTQIPDLTTTYTFMPVYSGSGDPNYGTVTGTPVTVIALRNPSVTISSSPASLTVADGSSTSTNLTLTSLLGYGVAGALSNLNNYSLPLEMECDGLPAHASCTFAYPNPDPSDANSVAVTTTTPGQVVMTLNTNAPVGTSASLMTHPGSYLASVFGLGLLGLAFPRRRRTLRKAVFSVMTMLLLAAAITGLSACSTANISQAAVLTTPKGTYTITVTAKEAGSKQVPNSIAGAAPITVYGNGNQVSVPFTMSVTIQ